MLVALVLVLAALVLVPLVLVAFLLVALVLVALVLVALVLAEVPLYSVHSPKLWPWLQQALQTRHACLHVDLFLSSRHFSEQASLQERYLVSPHVQSSS